MRELFIRKLIKMVEQSDIESLEVSSWGRRVRIHKTRPSTNGQKPSASPSAVEARVPTIEVATPPPPAEQSPAAAAPASTLHEITSPMVGTFYRAPSPDAKPFVEVGDRVAAGQVVCIVEAMKLMNEIQSDVEGTVAEIMVDNQMPVEYGQPLFRIKPN